MNKYDWLSVSEEIISIATDSKGRVLGYDVESPNLAKNKDGSIGQFTSSYYWLLKNQEAYQGDWKDSLETRPNV